MRRRIIAIVGDAKIKKDGPKYRLAYETAKELVDRGYRIQCGGLRGVMEAACAGAHASEKYKEGDTIAIIPGFDGAVANEYADIVIPTGLDLYRNVIVANASAVIAIGGGSGTLCEISNAWALKRLIVAFNHVDGWSAKVAGTCLDDRLRYHNIPDDKIYSASSAKEAADIIDEKVALYDGAHIAIPVNP